MIIENYGIQIKLLQPWENVSIFCARVTGSFTIMITMYKRGERAFASFLLSGHARHEAATLQAQITPQRYSVYTLARKFRAGVVAFLYKLSSPLSVSLVLKKSALNQIKNYKIKNQKKVQFFIILKFLFFTDKLISNYSDCNSVVKSQKVAHVRVMSSLF